MLTLIRNFRADRARRAQEAADAVAAELALQEQAAQAALLQEQQAKDQADAAKRDEALAAERAKQELIDATASERIDLVEVSQQFARVDSAAAVNSSMDLAGLLRELASRHQQELKDLLPVERQNAPQLVAQFNEAQLALKSAYASTKWPLIEMDFLQRRKWSASLECRVPLFAIFNVSSANCVIAFRWSDGRQGLRSAGGFEKHFQDVFAMLEERNRAARAYSYRRWNDSAATTTTSLQADFNGLIPQSVRAKIKDAGQVFEDIYIVTDSVDWKLDTVVSLDPRVDPLVIGRIKDQFWLIDVFDLTAAEDHARREYTLGSLSAKPN